VQSLTSHQHCMRHTGFLPTYSPRRLEIRDAYQICDGFLHNTPPQRALYASLCDPDSSDQLASTHQGTYIRPRPPKPHRAETLRCLTSSDLRTIRLS